MRIRKYTHAGELRKGGVSYNINSYRDFLAHMSWRFLKSTCVLAMFTVVNAVMCMKDGVNFFTSQAFTIMGVLTVVSLLLFIIFKALLKFHDMRNNVM